jgi:hypothetical protein
MSEYPLFPELPPVASEQAQILIDKFKEQLALIAEKTISEFYCDVAVHIESDSWTNFRNQLLDGLKNYDNRKIQASYDFKAIRKSILENHREEIISDLNQDMVNEIISLKEQISSLIELYKWSY